MTNYNQLIENEFDVLTRHAENTLELAESILPEGDPLRVKVSQRVKALLDENSAANAFTGEAYAEDEYGSRPEKDESALADAITDLWDHRTNQGMKFLASHEDVQWMRRLLETNGEDQHFVDWLRGGNTTEDRVVVIHENDSDYDDYQDEDEGAYEDENYVPLPGRVGVVVNEEEGSFVVEGDVEEMAEVALDMLAERDFEGREEEVEVSPLFSVLYSPEDEDNPLTIDDVQTILRHPISSPLDHLGRIELLSIVRDPDDYSSQRANFILKEEGTLPIQALAANVLRYAGSHTFPGIGTVYASGEFHGE